MNYVYLALSGVSIIPIIIVLLFPQNRVFFEKPIVRGFGLGVYLMLVILLMSEAFEKSGAVTSLFLFASGLVLSILIGFVLKEFHHHHSETEKAHSHNKSSTWRILISDFFHNIVDGIAIIAGFSINIGAGITSFFGILGHQIIQQASQQILLVESNVKPKKAILISFFISLSIFLGFVFKDNETFEVIFIALSAGKIGWKVGTDMIHSNWNRKMILGFIIGALLLGLILVLVPHGH